MHGEMIKKINQHLLHSDVAFISLVGRSWCEEYLKKVGFYLTDDVAR